MIEIIVLSDENIKYNMLRCDRYQLISTLLPNIERVNGYG